MVRCKQHAGQGDVHLVPFSRRHAPATLKWVNRPELKHFTGTLFPVSKRAHAAWVRGLLDDPLRRWFAIECGGAHVGNTGIKRLDKTNRSAELFIYIGAPEHRRRGVGARASRLLAALCFHNLFLHRVYAQVFSFNEAALVMYRRAGFVKEATLRKHYYHGGRWHDQIVLSLLRHGIY
mgnify:CR=1 FL=1